MRKNIWREIRATMGRFVAIFAISALGAGFFAGLKATSPDMKATADSYYKQQNLADFRLLSTMGFTQDDVQALRAQQGVQGVMPGWALDVLAKYPEGVVAIHMAALPEDTTDTNNAEYFNRPVLVEGRLPQAANECVVDDATEYQIGDVIEISDENTEAVLDLLQADKFTVVGRVRSAAYIAMMRGNTTIGDGRIAYYIYTTPDAFDKEYYTQILVSATGTQGLSSFSNGYSQTVEKMEQSLTTLGKERSRIRYADVRRDAQEELAEARQKLVDAETELADAKEELADGKAEAERELAKAWQKIADGEAELRKGRDELARGQVEIDTNTARLIDAQQQVDAGQAELDKSRAILQDGQRQYEEGYEKFSAEKQRYEQGTAMAGQLAAQAAALDAAAVQMQAWLDIINDAGAAPADIAEAEAAFVAAAGQSAGGLRQIAAALAAAGYDASALVAAADGMDAAMQLPGGAGYAVALGILQNAVAGLNAQVADIQNQLAAGLPALQAAEQQLLASKAKLDAGWAELAQGEAALAAARQQVYEGDKLLTAARETLTEARKKLADAERELADGKAKYYEEKAEAEQEIADGEQKIADGETEIADGQQKLADGEQALEDLKQPEWYILTREDNPGYSGFSSDTGRIDAIALVIPVFFFLVAALVCLTTMTRMVEEQRSLIGTLKALGYSRLVIASKYLIYAAVASTTGAVLGVLVGFVAFPSTIWQAYGIMYNMPPIMLWGNVLLAVGSVAVCVLTTTAATLAACWRELRSVPASLMRPKAPRAGKRVLLEHIPPLWRRMSFMQKVTARNLLRYKKRFFMTVIGVAGCTALLVTGFGLRDSISGIVGIQFGEINTYDMVAVLKDPSSAAADTELNSLLPDFGESIYTTDTLVHAKSEGGTSGDMTVYVYVAENPEQLNRFFHFRNRKTGEEIAFPQSGAVVTEKLADRLRVKPGDTITVNRTNEVPAPLTVGAVMENYVFNYLFVTPEQYTQLFGKPPEYNRVLLNLREGVQEDTVLPALLDASPVAGAQNIKALRGEMDDMFSSLNSVVWLVILSAGMLAFVVLYNLTNINITERSREIATLKVLGFYNKEVSSYVFRENVLLTLIGAAVGLVLGIFLHDFVITTAEIDEVMFRRVIEPLSFVWSVVFTMLSASIVNLVMMGRLRKIDMVESLKANE